MTHSLEVRHGETLVFSHDGKWLHPLFELEDFLRDGLTDPASLALRDRIIGKAAAMLILRMGIRTVYGEVMSAPAQELLIAHHATVEFGSLVDRIACMTEELFARTDDLDEAWRILRVRAGRDAPGRG